MQLITKDFTHVVTYYKEFFDGEEMHYDVIVHIAGKKHKKIDEKTMTSDEIRKAITYNKGIDDENKGRKAEWLPINEAIKKYNLEFKYWCAPDHINYGDQKIPGTDKLLTPKKQWK